jgi:TRAP-type mannitol/chloroaromatic compound transport system permease large subunit
MSAFIAQQFVPLLFLGLFCFLLTGFPVAFSLAACGLLFGLIGMQAGIFPGTLFQALPLACSASCRTTRCSRSRSSRSWA